MLHASRRRPQRHHETDQSTETEALRRALDDRRELRLDQVANLPGRGSQDVVDVPLDVGGVCDQPVHRHEGEQGGYEGEEREEGHAGRQQRHVVPLDLALQADRDIPQPPERDGGGTTGQAPALDILPEEGPFSMRHGASLPGVRRLTPALARNTRVGGTA
jgi:hypothetical protein